jgi:hypothetical protein
VPIIFETLAVISNEDINFNNCIILHNLGLYHQQITPKWQNII